MAMADGKGVGDSLKFRKSWHICKSASYCWGLFVPTSSGEKGLMQCEGKCL